MILAQGELVFFFHPFSGFVMVCFDVYLGIGTLLGCRLCNHFGVWNEGIEIVVPLEEGAPMGTSLLTNEQWVKNFLRRSLLLYEEVNKSYFLFQDM
jgi:hypothetical protein